MQKVYVKKVPKLKSYKSHSRIARVFLAPHFHNKVGIILLLFGASIVFASLSPQKELAQNTNIVNPVPIDVLAQGIAQTNVQIDQQYPLGEFITSNSAEPDSSYTETFYISFPSLHLDKIAITPNIDSSDAKTYENILSHSVAHFKGTPLPGEGGNTFIYGHSSVLWYHYLNPHSYEGVFSALFDLQIGDPITIDFNNHTYSYVVEGISTISANDFSQIQNIKGVNTLTLMTCSPPGIGDKRLIVKALQI